MKSLFASACAVMALGMAGSAFADGSITATLDAPVSGHQKLIAAHSVFNCEGVTCVAAIAPDESNGWDSCQDLAKQVGRVVSYKEFKALDDKSLTKCNKVAAAPKTIGTASR